MSAMFASWRERLPGGSGDVGRGGLREGRRPVRPVLSSSSCIPAVLVLTGSSDHALDRAPHVPAVLGLPHVQERRARPCCTAARRTRRRDRVGARPREVVRLPGAGGARDGARSRCSRSRSRRALFCAALDRVDSRVASGSSASAITAATAIALLSAPFANSLGLGAISPFLLVGVALALAVPRSGVDRRCIRCCARDAQALPLAAAALAGIHATLPGGAALPSVLMAAVTLASWAVLGFAGLRDLLARAEHPHPPRRGEGLFARRARALARRRDDRVARALPWIVGGAAARADRGCAAARRVTTRWTFVVAIGAAFALSPIIWLHYFVLLYIPIAIVRPRLSWLWALPLALWVCRGQSIDGAVWDKVRKHQGPRADARGSGRRD